MPDKDKKIILAARLIAMEEPWQWALGKEEWVLYSQQ
jgi:hypothetical protein